MRTYLKEYFNILKRMALIFLAGLAILLPFTGNLYIIIITAIIFIAVIMTSLASNDMKVSIYSGKNTDIKMFFFGFAFLLLESKCITQMNLVWGATWLTSAVVFGSILAMIFFSTISISHNYVSAKTNAILLITFLIIVYFFPITFS